MRVILIMLCLAGSFLLSIGQTKWTEKDGYVWYQNESEDNKEWVTDESGKTIVPKDLWVQIIYQNKNGYQYFVAFKKMGADESRCAIFSLNGDLLIPASKYSLAWANEDGTFTGTGGHAKGYETIRVDKDKLKATDEWRKPINMADMLFLFGHAWEEGENTYEFNLNFNNDKIDVLFTVPDVLGALFGMDVGPTVIKGILKIVSDTPSLGLIEWETNQIQPFNIIGISRDEKKFQLDDGRILQRKD